jgi:hypothetical protein
LMYILADVCIGLDGSCLRFFWEAFTRSQSFCVFFGCVRTTGGKHGSVRRTPLELTLTVSPIESAKKERWKVKSLYTTIYSISTKYHLLIIHSQSK